MSNFWSAVVRGDDGYDYGSVEVAYQAAKSHDPRWKKLCQNPFAKPGDIKRAARGIEIRPDWDGVKRRVMKNLVRQKMTQEPFKSQLLATGDQNIQEGNHWGDEFWGINLKTGIGENHLGRIVMEIREELQEDG